MRHRVPVAARVLACVLFACAALAPAAPAQSVAVPRGLPEGTVYDPAIPTPASVLGYEVGDWHVRPDLIRRYLEALAAASDRVTLEEYARTHEARPLLLATITSPAPASTARRCTTVPAASNAGRPSHGTQSSSTSSCPG